MTSENKRTKTPESSNPMHILISNIPLTFRSADLRNFFSYSVEKESFVTFNFRKRPHASGQFNMCICAIKPNKFDEIIKLYDKKNWIDSKNKLMLLKCSIVKINLNNNKSNDQVHFENLSDLLEFQRIPSWMPNGNVGTPTKVFIEYINKCIMPPSLISRLGLNIKKYRKHKIKVMLSNYIPFHLLNGNY